MNIKDTGKYNDVGGCNEKNKPVVNMTDWEVNYYKGQYFLEGIAEYHPVMGRDACIYRTTAMISYDFREDVLTFETKNTVYSCPLKYMTESPFSNTVPDHIKELSLLADGSDDILERIVAASAKFALIKGTTFCRRMPVRVDPFMKHIQKLQRIGKEELRRKDEAENRRLADLLREHEDSIYIEVSNVHGGNRLAYHLGKEFGTVMPRVHTGMFQDSVLYMQYAGEDRCALDFRYFPKGWNDDIIETYSWSDNIRQAIIKNERDRTLTFNGTILSPWETGIFTSEGC